MNTSRPRLLKVPATQNFASRRKQFGIILIILVIAAFLSIAVSTYFSIPIRSNKVFQENKTNHITNSSPQQITRSGYFGLDVRLNKSYLIYNGKIYEPWYSYPNLDALNFDYTVISAYILISSSKNEKNRPRHNDKGFQTWMLNFYKLNSPLVTFLDVNLTESDEFIDTIRPHIISHSMTVPRIIVPFELADMETYYYKDIIDKLYKIWGTKTSQKLCYIWLEKSHFVRKVALLNPYNSKYFFWIDIGVFREFDHKEIANYPDLTIKNGIGWWPAVDKLSLLNNNRVWILHTYSIDKSVKYELCKELLNEKTLNPLRRYQLGWIAGTYFGGTQQAILMFDSMVTMFFHDGILFSTYNKYKSGACIDQNIWADIFCHFPDIVTIITPPSSYHYPKSAIWSSYLWFFQSNYSTNDWNIE